MDPPYLRLERPQLDFVSLAKAFGGENGEVVETPGAVKDAIRRGIDHVLTQPTSYILDMRIAGNTPTAPSTSDAITAYYSKQPVLDYFHKDAVKTKLLSAGNGHIPSNIPSIF